MRQSASSGLLLEVGQRVDKKREAGRSLPWLPIFILRLNGPTMMRSRKVALTSSSARFSQLLFLPFVSPLLKL